MENIRSVLNDAAVEAMSLRNQERAMAAIALMGTKYVGHPTKVLTRDSARSKFVPPIDTTLPGASLVRLGGAE